MRKATNDVKLLTVEGHFVSVCLGWDYAGEHEFGIRRIQDAFGIPGIVKRKSGTMATDLVGADVRTVTRCSDALRLIPFKDAAYLFFDYTVAGRGDDVKRRDLDSFLGIYTKTEESVSAAWSESDFGLRVANQDTFSGRLVLGELFEAFQKKDVMIFLTGSGNPFAGNGLHLAIRSRVPQEMLDLMRKADEESLNLSEAVAKTGIRERLEAAHKRYYALKPAWTEGFLEHSPTEHPVMFFLNPMEQQANHHGWFTVEELDEWIAGKGPIPKDTTAS